MISNWKCIIWHSAFSCWSACWPPMLSPSWKVSAFSGLYFLVVEEEFFSNSSFRSIPTVQSAILGTANLHPNLSFSIVNIDDSLPRPWIASEILESSCVKTLSESLSLIGRQSTSGPDRVSDTIGFQFGQVHSRANNAGSLPFKRQESALLKSRIYRFSLKISTMAGCSSILELQNECDLLNLFI